MNRRLIAATAAALSLTVITAGFWLALPRLRAPAAAPTEERADKIKIEKGERKLYLLKQGKVLREYKIALGFAPEGHKQREGDGKTPEGLYRISGRNPHSKFHLSLRVSYPNAEDRKQAAAKGVSPGGDIMIHGLPNATPFLGSLHRLKTGQPAALRSPTTKLKRYGPSLPTEHRLKFCPKQLI